MRGKRGEKQRERVRLEIISEEEKKRAKRGKRYVELKSFSAAFGGVHHSPPPKCSFDTAIIAQPILKNLAVFRCFFAFSSFSEKDFPARKPVGKFIENDFRNAFSRP